MSNLDPATVAGFGDEWDAFDQSALSEEERQQLFNRYFSIFPWELLPPDAEGFDLGCGSGRWAALMAPRVATLHCIDPAEKALAVARRNVPSARFHHASAEAIPLPDKSQDFGYSIGVLHHIPDTRKALSDCVRKLKPGAPFLVYLYYRFDNRPLSFRLIWRASDIGRRVISRLPLPLKRGVTFLIAASVYWPLAKLARGPNWPLASYKTASFYTMRTDAFDRFCTRLEQRFTRPEIEAMMKRSGLERIRFSDHEPFWVAVGQAKRKSRVS